MHLNEYSRWASYDLEDEDLAKELKAIKNNPEDIKDRFAISLSFGTAGLRGVLGAGTNRMNIYTVRRATQGLANYINTTTQNPSVAIAYDSRIKSDLFSREAALVLAANGIKTYIYPRLQPVPALSFAVRKLKTSAGIMITASHNPAKYNGFKAYGFDGCQMTDDASNAVFEETQKIDALMGAKTISFETALENGIIEYISESVLEDYYTKVKAESIRKDVLQNSNLKLVYSPLNGAGNEPVRRVLQDMGVSDITVVPQQEMPDGNFPTCPYPNPEIREALHLGLELAKSISADLMLATDPDADRVGIAVRSKAGEYHLLSGNEVGVLLLDYICAGRLEAKNMPTGPIAVKSIVTTPLANAVAKHYNVQLVDVLTGFKYIGEQILCLEEKGEENRFIFGFEESYGYLAGTYVRDKDAVIASMLICEMAAYYRKCGSSLYEKLGALYKQYGYYYNKVDSFEFVGLAGMDKIKSIMQNFRTVPLTTIASLPVSQTADLLAQTTTQMNGTQSKISLPKADVLIYTLEAGDTVIVRPSGTEPKLKIYYTTLAKTLEAAQEKQQTFKEELQQRLQ